MLVSGRKGHPVRRHSVVHRNIRGDLTSDFRWGICMLARVMAVSRGLLGIAFSPVRRDLDVFLLRRFCS